MASRLEKEYDLTGVSLSCRCGEIEGTAGDAEVGAASSDLCREDELPG